MSKPNFVSWSNHPSACSVKGKKIEIILEELQRSWPHPGARHVISLVRGNMELPIQCPRRFLGIIGRDPSVSKSNWLHIDIFQIFLHQFEVVSQILLNDR
jgi:hypothetical protein